MNIKFIVIVLRKHFVNHSIKEINFQYCLFFRIKMMKNESEYNLILKYLKDFKTSLVSYEEIIFSRRFYQNRMIFEKLLINHR